MQTDSKGHRHRAACATVGILRCRHKLYNVLHRIRRLYFQAILELAAHLLQKKGTLAMYKAFNHCRGYLHVYTSQGVGVTRPSGGGEFLLSLPRPNNCIFPKFWDFKPDLCSQTYNSAKSILQRTVPSPDGRRARELEEATKLACKASTPTVAHTKNSML